MVTGGGTGLGFGAARALHQVGATVAIFGRRDQVLKQAADEIGCAHVVCDVTDRRQVAGALATIIDRLGRVDILVNVAGLNIRGIRSSSATRTGTRSRR